MEMAAPVSHYRANVRFRPVPDIKAAASQLAERPPPRIVRTATSPAGATLPTILGLRRLRLFKALAGGEAEVEDHVHSASYVVEGIVVVPDNLRRD